MESYFSSNSKRSKQLLLDTASSPEIRTRTNESVLKTSMARSQLHSNIGRDALDDEMLRQQSLNSQFFTRPIYMTPTPAFSTPMAYAPMYPIMRPEAPAKRENKQISEFLEKNTKLLENLLDKVGQRQEKETREHEEKRRRLRERKWREEITSEIEELRMMRNLEKGNDSEYFRDQINQMQNQLKSISDKLQEQQRSRSRMLSQDTAETNVTAEKRRGQGTSVQPLKYSGMQVLQTPQEYFNPPMTNRSYVGSNQMNQSNLLSGSPPNVYSAQNFDALGF